MKAFAVLRRDGTATDTESCEIATKYFACSEAENGDVITQHFRPGSRQDDSPLVVGWPHEGYYTRTYFHRDGTVEWHAVKGNEGKPDVATGSEKDAGNDQDGKQAERPSYAASKVTNEVCLVSYLSRSGYTLTVVLSFNDGSTVGVASNEKTWFPVRGRFEIVDARNTRSPADLLDA
ncbi:MAG: hypothetical protein ACRD9W_00050 [Terriglobia bacterium]